MAGQSPYDGFGPWKAERSLNSEQTISYEREQTIQLPSMIMTGRQERRGPNMELSKPMNDIDTAVEYFRKVADPSSVNTIKDEAPDPSHFKGDKIPEPPVATEGGPAARPGHPTGSMLPYYYRQSRTMAGGLDRRGHDVGLKPMNEAGKAGEYTKEAAKPPPVSTVPKRDSNPETIDGREAARRYNGRFVNPETIDSQVAARRYNGRFVNPETIDGRFVQ